VVAVALFAERVLFFHRINIEVSEFLGGLSSLLRRGKMAEALHEAAATPGPVARVVHAALLLHDKPRSELKEIVQESAQLEVPFLERHLRALQTLAFIAPMLGLLGTVLGMVDAFTQISGSAGLVTVNDLSAAVYKSLITSALGLSVAIPAFAATSYLSSRVDRFMHDMRRAGVEIVTILSEKSTDEGIVSFTSVQPKEKQASS
jgi:biopolymer transport protein ExbB